MFISYALNCQDVYSNGRVVQDQERISACFKAFPERGGGVLQDIPIDSDALRANITGTAREVEIPDAYTPLLEAVKDFYGVRVKLVETLQEYFHEFRNIDAVIEGFQVILLRNWSYFESSGDRERLFSLLAGLLADLLGEDLTRCQISALLRQILMWLSSGLSGPHSDSYIAAAVSLIGKLPAKAETDPVPFLERDSLLRDTVVRASFSRELSTLLLKLYRRVLARGYGMILERMDIIRWCRDKDTDLSHPEEVISRFNFLEKGVVSSLLNSVETASPEELLSVRSL